MPQESSRTSPLGLPPGTLVHVGKKRVEQARITLLRYTAEDVEERQVESIEECLEPPPDAVTWINVDGLHEVEVIHRLGEAFGLHPLVLEDIVNTRQRPKVEDYDDYLYIVLKMLYHNADAGRVEAEQVSLVLKPGLVISFQERPGDVFDPARERIRGGKGRIRGMGADYLVYSLFDAVVDSYFAICEGFSDRLEDLEERTIEEPEPETSRRIHSAKRELILLRKSLWPLREVIGALQRTESPLIGETTALYLRDVYDHTIQVIDTVESFRDMAAGLLDIYLSSLSNRMNEVMKVLTIIATLFIPLTFIAGIYGMNFRYMPELDWRWGYPAVLAVMLGIAILMLFFFRRRKWL
ncbi:MAG: magnesium/cobalt transporter CorA [Candidatus Brocadiia bacterium]